MNDLSPTFGLGKDPAFVEPLRLLAEEVGQVHFEIVFVVEFFLTQVISERAEQMVVGGSQV